VPKPFHSGDVAFELCYLHDMPAVLRALAGAENSIEKCGSSSTRPKHPEGSFKVVNALAMASKVTIPIPRSPSASGCPWTFDTCEVIEDRWANLMRQDPMVAVEAQADSLRSASPADPLRLVTLTPLRSAVKSRPKTRDSLIKRINSLMGRFNSLLGRNKFPVSMRRELGCKSLNLFLDSKTKSHSGAQTNKIPCIFPASREFGSRDEFARDCPLQR
jgi:hypothetical protein